MELEECGKLKSSHSPSTQGGRSYRAPHARVSCTSQSPLLAHTFLLPASHPNCHALPVQPPTSLFNSPPIRGHLFNSPPIRGHLTSSPTRSAISLQPAGHQAWPGHLGYASQWEACAQRTQHDQGLLASARRETFWYLRSTPRDNFSLQGLTGSNTTLNKRHVGAGNENQI